MAAIVPFLDRTKKTEDTGTPDEACPIGEPPGGPLPTLEGLLGCGDCGAPQDPSLGDAGLVEGLGPPKFEGIGDFSARVVLPEKRKAAVPAWLKSGESAYRWALKHADIEHGREYRADYINSFDTYADKADEIVRAGQTTLYRAITLPAGRGVDAINWRCLGKAWSWKKQGAATQGLVPYKGDRIEVVLVGIVGAQHVDWEYGFTSYTSYGEDQAEISLLENTPVRVVTILVRGEAGGYDKENWVEQPLTPPVEGNTGSAGETWATTCPPVKDRAAPSSLGDFGVVRDVPELESSHAELTRTAWIRRGLEEELLTGGKSGGPRDFWVESDCKTGELFFHLDPAMQKDILPWYVGVGDVARFALFGSNGKMKCPTWDLPAGAPSIGGSCPGATAGQTVVEPEKRHGQLVDGQLLPVPGLNVIQSVDERRAICQNCYALEGNYPSPHVQIGEILRYWWTRSMLAEGRGEEWIETMVRAVGALNIPRTRQGIRPIRVHSAGDFFSPQYAEAWMEVANRVWDLEVTYGRTTPEIRFWAPTRTWAAKGFDWDKIANRLAQPNMIVRPSSYHVDDPAPGMLTEGWPMGATSIINDHNRGMVPEMAQVVTGEAAQIERLRAEQRAHAGLGPDDRYDWQCMTYAIALKGKSDLAPSCEDAIAPDGKRGCRACWTHPQLRVNYTTH